MTASFSIRRITKIAFLCIVILQILPSICYSQKIEELREDLIDSIRDFRKDIKSKDTDFVLLRKNCSDMISIAKSMKQIGELQNLQNYFHQIIGVISNSTTKIDSATIAKNINQDLSLKLTAARQSLEFESITGFGKMIDIEVTVYLDGKRQESGSYRVYWGTYLGTSQESIIKVNKFEGLSTLFKNPYKLSVRMPGIITFWMQDTKNGHWYKADFPWLKILNENQKAFEISFIPLRS